MIKVLFICLGNICRSPMAEFVFKDMVKKSGAEDEFYIASAATSNEAVGSPVHRGTKMILSERGIYCDPGKRAVQMTAADYSKYDYILCMEERNRRAILRKVGGDTQGKVFRLCDFTDAPRDIADPWYTGNFEDSYRDIVDGCSAFLKRLHRDGALKLKN